MAGHYKQQITVNSKYVYFPRYFMSQTYCRHTETVSDIVLNVRN